MAAAAINLVMLLRLVRSFRMLRMIDTPIINSDDLPTVSVCISARNETTTMTRCLEQVVASEYPKLEVIVLDDGSRDDTSILIKSFAHAGVRFVEGHDLPQGWLGKNYSQSVLAAEASGKYIFYMDVDTIIGRHTITRLVSYLTAHRAKMVSIIPMRRTNMSVDTLFSTMRHFWTFILFSPRKPLAESNAWLVEREYILQQFQSNAELQTAMLLESNIARALYGQEQFRLAISNDWMDIRYEKPVSAQRETSIRLLFAQNNALTIRALLMFVCLVVTALPYVLIFVYWLFIVPIALQLVVSYVFNSRVWHKYALIGALATPYNLAQEAWLVLVSWYRYKTGKVTWKGRPISISHPVIATPPK